jgi:hypothetical protein
MRLRNKKALDAKWSFRGWNPEIYSKSYQANCCLNRLLMRTVLVAFHTCTYGEHHTEKLATNGNQENSRMIESL